MKRLKCLPTQYQIFLEYNKSLVIAFLTTFRSVDQRDERQGRIASDLLYSRVPQLLQICIMSFPSSLAMAVERAKRAERAFMRFLFDYNLAIVSRLRDNVKERVRKTLP